MTDKRDNVGLRLSFDVINFLKREAHEQSTPENPVSYLDLVRDCIAHCYPESQRRVIGTLKENIKYEKCRVVETATNNRRG